MTDRQPDHSRLMAEIFRRADEALDRPFARVGSVLDVRKTTLEEMGGAECITITFAWGENLEALDPSPGQAPDQDPGSEPAPPIMAMDLHVPLTLFDIVHPMIARVHPCASVNGAPPDRGAEQHDGVQ